MRLIMRNIRSIRSLRRTSDKSNNNRYYNCNLYSSKYGSYGLHYNVLSGLIIISLSGSERVNGKSYAYALDQTKTCLQFYFMLSELFL